jgi:hypothetical protein
MRGNRAVTASRVKYRKLFIANEMIADDLSQQLYEPFSLDDYDVSRAQIVVN